MRTCKSTWLRMRQVGVLVLALIALCAPAAARAQEPSSLLFVNGRILLNDGKGGAAEALLTDGTKVAAVGAADVLRNSEAGQRAKIVDLAGAVAVPGLQDAHGHLERYALALDSVDLTGSSTYDELIRRVRAQAEKQKEGTWIIGRGWDEELWADKGFPHHILLSAQVPAHPVYLERADGHVALVNRAALALAKLDGVLEGDAKVLGGRMLYDTEGKPSGILVESAMELVRRVIPAPDPEVARRRFLRAQAELLARGITAVHDMGTSPATLQLLTDLRDRGELTLRVVSYVAGNGEFNESLLKGLPIPPDSEDRLCVAGIKFICDGALSSRGAFLFEAYEDAPGERGSLWLTENELATRISQAVQRGLQPAVHAVGDRANRIVLDIYERLAHSLPGMRDLRPRIEHAQIVSTRDWPRFPALGIVPSMQPGETLTHLDRVRARLGAKRSPGAYVWRGLAPELGRLAFGSDFPMHDPNPLLGLFAARTHGFDPEAEKAPTDDALGQQALDGASALAGFTSGAAYACRQEDRRGRLNVGYAADLTVLSVDPVTCAAEDLLHADVRLTVINGRIVYRAK